ncbi:MAG: aldo/keto reductase, partial [Desulfobacterales bacterium]
IAAVQYEYSLWRREVEIDLLPTLWELGTDLVAWSPLGSGFLTGTVRELEQNDFRQNNLRFNAENLVTYRDRFTPLTDLARELEVTPARLALSWLLHQGHDIFPIPGTRRTGRIDENAGAAKIKLDPATVQRINALAPTGLAEGTTLI